MVYLDSSALVKIVVLEPESRALRTYLRREPQRVSCGLARTEVLRAVRPGGPAAIEAARRVLRSIDLIRLDDALLDAAGLLEPIGLRSLDAIHLAAAQLIAPALHAVVTYDRRLADAATSLGLPVAAPPWSTPAVGARGT
jgi:predicted nucleic acid-binding protein